MPHYTQAETRLLPGEERGEQFPPVVTHNNCKSEQRRTGKPTAVNHMCDRHESEGTLNTDM